MSYETYKITTDLTYGQIQSGLHRARVEQGIATGQFMKKLIANALKFTANATTRIAQKLHLGGGAQGTAA